MKLRHLGSLKMNCRIKIKRREILNLITKMKIQIIRTRIHLGVTGVIKLTTVMMTRLKIIKTIKRLKTLLLPKLLIKVESVKLPILTETIMII